MLKSRRTLTGRTKSSMRARRPSKGAPDGCVGKRSTEPRRVKTRSVVLVDVDFEARRCWASPRRSRTRLPVLAERTSSHQAVGGLPSGNRATRLGKTSRDDSVTDVRTRPQLVGETCRLLQEP
jgi:hypothetical protein